MKRNKNQADLKFVLSGINNASGKSIIILSMKNIFYIQLKFGFDYNLNLYLIIGKQRQKSETIMYKLIYCWEVILNSH